MKMARVSLVVSAAIAASSIPAYGFIGKVVQVVAAPITAPANLVKNAVEGKPITPEAAASALSPTFAQAHAADKQTGTTKKIRGTVKKLDQTIDNAHKASETANVVLHDAKGLIGKGDAVADKGTEAIEESKNALLAFFGMIKTPTLAVLWALFALIVIKIVKSFKTTKA